MSALREVRVDHCIGVAAMAPLLANLAEDRKPLRISSMEVPVADELKLEVDIAAHEGTASDVLKLGVPSLFTCPECHGALLQIGEEGPMRFRCHTGHAFTANSLVAALGESTEAAVFQGEGRVRRDGASCVGPLSMRVIAIATGAVIRTQAATSQCSSFEVAG
jgi:two-component system chemotaxis response regulator CheB